MGHLHPHRFYFSFASYLVCAPLCAVDMPVLVVMDYDSQKNWVFFGTVYYEFGSSVEFFIFMLTCAPFVK